MSDLINKQDAITIPILPVAHRKYQTMNLDDAYELGWLDCQKCIEELPSAQQEITLESVVDYLHSIGWMQEHDRIMAESTQPERESGEWIIADTQNEEDEQNGNYRYICSCCGYSDIHSRAVRVPYCWHCGADMTYSECKSPIDHADKYCRNCGAKLDEEVSE